VTGKCFETATAPHLKTIHLTQCLALREKYLLYLFERSPRIENLYLKDLFKSSSSGYAYGMLHHISEQSTIILKSIVNNLHATLANFEFTIKKNSLYLDQFVQCDRLTRLDLSNSFCDNKKLAVLLNRLRALTYLDLNSAHNLSDELFTTLPIHAPLHYLDISCLNELTDVTLLALASGGNQLATCMRRLEMSCCTKLTRDGILKLIESMPRLEYLNMSVIGSVDSAFLETLCGMRSRESKIHICCHFAAFNINEVRAALGEDARVIISETNEQYEIKLKNFTIEVDI
jgi:hypothetical protein